MCSLGKTALIIMAVLFAVPHGSAQENKTKAMPPPNVVVSKVNSGFIVPEAEFVGTVYYQEMSDVASEVNGSVEAVQFEEGNRVKKGDVLVRLNTDLLEKTLQANRALHEQVLAEVENATADLRRMESLFREELVSEKTYDDHRYRVMGLQKKAAAVKAEVERLEVELRKKNVVTPFDGVIVRKNVERGEWVAPGTSVFTVARVDVIDVIVEVPETVMKSVKPGTMVKVRAGTKEITGKVFSITPRGDIATRTFPVRIRISNPASLMEGMEARVVLPTGKQEKTFMVPRDAVITLLGSTVVFAVMDAKAKMIPVRVAGYSGMTAGIHADGLAEGMNVVIKGHERLMDGQEVGIVNGK